MIITASVQRFSDGVATAIVTQPTDASITSGQSAIFFIGVNTTASYQWQEDSGGGFANVSEGASYIGVTTNQLEVVNPVLNNSYRCLVTGNTGVLTSSEASIIEINTFPAWETNANGWAAYSAALANMNNSQSQTVTTFGNFPGVDKWRSGATAPNGFIYCPPYGNSTILKIDPATDTATEFGSFTAGTFKFSSACLAPNGKIYCIPYLYNGKILVIDPTDDSYYEIGSGISSFIGAVLANNGCIYGIPYSSTTIVKIDTSDDSITTFGSLTGSANYSGGVLGANGKVYCCPYSSLKILVIDPTDDSTYELDHTGNGTACNGGAISKDGYIYFCPYSHSKVIKVGTTGVDEDVVTEFGNYVGTHKWRGFLQSGKNIMYGVPYEFDTFLRLDTSTDSLSTFGSVLGDNKYISGAMGLNGSLYLFPHYATSVLKLLSELPVPEDFALSRYVNKF